MNICGIVCEYNPFHNGHLFHIQETRRRGADGIVCVMSGNFVQRGDFAIMQKYARAEAAVRAGADVVIELPLPWALSSAERFAYGAMSILHLLGVITSVSFGAENDDVPRLLSLAEILASGELDNLILSEYSSGIPYAKAREQAIEKIDSNLSQLIKTPNNILAIEYLKALIRLKSNITPIAVPRTGADHDGSEINDGIASASYIRELLSRGGDISQFIPTCAFNIYMRETANGNAPIFIKSADISILSSLKKFAPEDFAKYSDVSEGLEFRIFDAVSKSRSLNEAVELTKTKRYAHARIRRIFLNAFLGVESYHSEGVPAYARILAFNDAGRDIIKSAKKSSQIPIITRPSSIKSESKKAKDLLALERRADDIYSLFMPSPIQQGNTFTRSPVYVKNNA